MALSDRFRALRVSCDEAWIIFANLDISNMGFEEYADFDAGVQADGTFKWVGKFEDSNDAGRIKQERKRAAALKAARDLGHID